MSFTRAPRGDIDEHDAKEREEIACCTKTAADEKQSVFVPLTTGFNSGIPPHTCNSTTTGACDTVHCQVPERSIAEHRSHTDVTDRNRVRFERNPPTDLSFISPPPLPTAPVSTTNAPLTNTIAPVQDEEAIRIPIYSRPYRPIIPVLCTSCSHSKSDPSCGTCTTGQKAMYTLSLDKQFLKALYWVRHAPPAADQKLREHHARIEREALYYQITEGDLTTSQPWAIHVEERERWDARDKLRGMSKEEAIVQYLRKVSEVEPHWIESSEVQCYTPIEENPLDSRML